MSTHHGQPPRHVKCAWCGKPVKRHVCHIKRRVASFCSRPCYRACFRAFLAQARAKLEAQLACD
jgi:hypothetical protein